MKKEKTELVDSDYIIDKWIVSSRTVRKRVEDGILPIAKKKGRGGKILLFKKEDAEKAFEGIKTWQMP